MSARRRFILSLIALPTVFVVGTTGYAAIEDGITLADAAYMTVITISTVGFGESWELDAAGRLWTAMVIVFGVGAGSLTLSFLFTFLVSGEIQAIRGRLRMQTQIDQLSDHVIICGYGRMGSLTVADLLSHGLQVVVVESSPERCRLLEEDGIPCVLGNATEDATLRKAGIDRAKALVSILTTDADNVYVTLSARGLRSDLTIVTRAEQPATEVKLLRAGANRVVCPQIIGAHRISNLISRPHIAEFVEVAAKGVELEISEYVVGSDSCLKDKTLRDSSFRRRCGGMVVAIRRADQTMLFTPEPDECIRESDTLVVIGSSGVSERLDELETTAPRADPRG